MVFKKQTQPKTFELYHLSDKNHDNEQFLPRSMLSSRVMEGEDWRTKRICVSSTIDGALSAIASCLLNPFGKEYYVHRVSNSLELFKKNAVYQPNENQVPDAMLTGELWLKKPACMQCIGKVMITDIDCAKKLSCTSADGEHIEVDAFKWKWTMQQPKACSALP